MWCDRLCVSVTRPSIQAEDLITIGRSTDRSLVNNHLILQVNDLVMQLVDTVREWLNQTDGIPFSQPLRPCGRVLVRTNGWRWEPWSFSCSRAEHPISIRPLSSKTCINTKISILRNRCTKYWGPWSQFHRTEWAGIKKLPFGFTFISFKRHAQRAVFTTSTYP